MIRDENFGLQENGKTPENSSLTTRGRGGGVVKTWAFLSATITKDQGIT